MMKFKEMIRNSAWGGAILNSYMYVYLRDYRQIKRVLNTFKKSASKDLISDMVNEHRTCKIPYNEYLLFHFDAVSNPKDRAKFVNDNERLIAAAKMNSPEDDPLFYDKAKTYQLFRKYYLRDVIRIDKTCSISEFESFVAKHPRFICKPIDGGCGTGIKIMNVEGKASPEKIFQSLIEEYNGKCFAEELIKQVGVLEDLHPKSVNTVRMPTVRFDDRVEVIHPFLRVGQGESITDNAGSGGILCTVDSKGIVQATADEFGNKFAVHPDSKKELIGFGIPKWEEAVELVKELAMCVPNNRYCSWDLALTEKGWALVEANAKGQFIWQYATQIGFRDELNLIMQELGLK